VGSVRIKKEILSMSFIRPRVQTGQILAGTLTKEFEMMVGSDCPENVVVFLIISAMSGSEKLDFYGQSPGMSDYADTVLATQIDIKAAESTTVRTLLVASTTGPLYNLKLVATNIASSETIDIVVLSW
jgi:hypothetical protein